MTPRTIKRVAIGGGALLLLGVLARSTSGKGGSKVYPKVTPNGGRRIKSGKPEPGAGDLVDVPAAVNRGATKIHKVALASFLDMFAAFTADLGPSLGGAGRIVSAWRSAVRQAELFAQTLAAVRAANPGASDEDVMKMARQRRAPAGKSEHETGLAIDLDLDGRATISKNDNARLRQTPLYKWMAANAARFGWYEYGASGADSGEAWHWVYNPA